jgi:hypothetical protein
MYEPFMTKGALKLGFLLPEKLRKRYGKTDYYQPYLEGLTTGILDVKIQALSHQRSKEKFSGIPMNKWPVWRKFPSAWFSLPGSMHKLLRNNFIEAEKIVGERYFQKFTAEEQKKLSLHKPYCYQIVQALRLCGEI